MDETVSAADANRHFSRLLRAVRQGRSYLVTSHGQPVARIVPASDQDRAPSRARDILFARLRRQRATRVVHWTRDELYESDE